MDPRKNQTRPQDDRVPDDLPADEDLVPADEAPGLEEQDWETIESGAIQPVSSPENGDFRFQDEPTGEAPEEDDDNPYQKSDEALPEDKDEAGIARNPSKEGSRFDEI